MKLIWCYDILWHLNVSAMGLCSSPHVHSSSTTERALTLQKKEGRWQNGLQPIISQVNCCSQLNSKHELKAQSFPVVCSMLRQSGVGRMLAPKTKLNSNAAGRSKVMKYGTLVWYCKDLLPCTGWSIVKLFAKASKCQLVSDTTWGVCKRKPDTNENILNDRETVCACFINHFPCSASHPHVAAVGRQASSPNPTPNQKLLPCAMQTWSDQAESRAGAWSGLSLLVTQLGGQTLILQAVCLSCTPHRVWMHSPTNAIGFGLMLTHTCNLTVFHQAFYALGYICDQHNHIHPILQVDHAARQRGLSNWGAHNRKVQ